MMKQPHPLNAPGDFYVENGMCIICRAPEHHAPDLMGFVEGKTGAECHCYFKRQPRSPEETQQAIRAIAASCCGALHYGGRDKAIVKALAKVGRREACDQ